MNKPRGAVLFTTLTLLTILAAPGAIQLLTEIQRGDRPQFLSVFDRLPTAQNLRAYERDLEDASRVVTALRPWTQYAQLLLLDDAGRKALIGLDGWLFYQPGVAYCCERAQPDVSPQSRSGPLPAIVGFRDQLEARNIRLLVVPGPNKESVYPEKLTRRAESIQAALCPSTRSLLKGLRAAGIEVVDLFQLFADAKRADGGQGEPLYLVQDSHWSPAGLSLAAREVASRLLESGWVRRGGVRYEERAAPLERIGDLVGMFQVPQIERHFLPEKISCVRVVRQSDGAAYADDPNAEILLLGDSFLRVFERDEPGAAGFTAHLARELEQPLASIVSDGGASTLVRQQLYRRPELLANKKVVIWQFVERDIRDGAEGWQNVPLPPLPPLP
jgi:hypothetical protein